MKKIIIILCLILAIAGGAYVYMQSSKFSITFKNVSDVKFSLFKTSGELNKADIVELVKNGMPNDVVFVDVRTVEEYENNHTEGTVNIPVALFDEDGACETIKEKLPKGSKIIFNCYMGSRSEEMYFNLIDPVEDGACGFSKEGLYFLRADIKYKKDKIIFK